MVASIFGKKKKKGFFQKLKERQREILKKSEKPAGFPVPKFAAPFPPGTLGFGSPGPSPAELPDIFRIRLPGLGKALPKIIPKPKVPRRRRAPRRDPNLPPPREAPPTPRPTPRRTTKPRPGELPKTPRRTIPPRPRREDIEPRPTAPPRPRVDPRDPINRPGITPRPAPPQAKPPPGKPGGDIPETVVRPQPPITTPELPKAPKTPSPAEKAALAALAGLGVAAVALPRLGGSPAAPLGFAPGSPVGGVPGVPIPPPAVGKIELPKPAPQAKKQRERCEKRRRQNRKTCWRGFYEEFTGRTAFTKWEKVDCRTRKRIKPKPKLEVVR